MPCVPWAPLLLGTVDKNHGFALIFPLLLASFQVGFFSGVKWLCFPISRGRRGAGSMPCCPPLSALCSASFAALLLGGPRGSFSFLP